MYFVYTLCYKGVIFYVGCAKDVHKRYQQHISIRNIQKTAVFIRDIFNDGGMPELNIITYTNYTHAINIEDTLIKCITKGGQILANVQKTSIIVKERKQGGFSSRLEAFNTILTKQNDYITKCNGYGGYYIVGTVGEKHHYPVKYRSS